MIDWQHLVIAPIGILPALAGWWMLRNASRAADATIRFERSSPTAKWAKPPGERSRAVETAGYRIAGAAFLCVGSAFALINLLIAFGVLTPAN